MRSLLIFTSVFIAALSLALVSVDGARAGGALDGKSYSVKIDDQGKKSDDELQFRDGMFFSVECEQYGFTEAPYTTTSGDGKTMFESTAMSPAEGKVMWKGAVEGDSISGTFVWTKEGQEPVEYTFEGGVKE